HRDLHLRGRLPAGRDRRRRLSAQDRAGLPGQPRRGPDLAAGGDRGQPGAHLPPGAAVHAGAGHGPALHRHHLRRGHRLLSRRGPASGPHTALRVQRTRGGVPPTITTSAGRRANSPTLTTPGTWLSACSRPTGSVMASPWTSSTQFPLSVTVPWRQTGWPHVRATISRATRLRAIGMTSIGSGKRPSTSTSFEGSMMHTNRSAASAMIFSRVSAAPPPL